METNNSKKMVGMKMKCAEKNCNLHAYYQKVCPIHLLKKYNEIHVDKIQEWIYHSSRQELIMRKRACDLLINTNSKNIKIYLSSKDDLSIDWSDWWFGLLTLIHNNF